MWEEAFEEGFVEKRIEIILYKIISQTQHPYAGLVNLSAGSFLKYTRWNLPEILVNC